MNRVFVWATGQDDNLGDSALRRAYLSALRDLGSLTVWHGPASPGFIAGLGIMQDDRTTASYQSWFVSAVISAARQRTFIAINAGEVPVSRRGAARIVTLIPLILFAQARRGGGVWMGAGIPKPGSGKVLALPYRVLASVCREVGVRDESSTAVVGNQTLMPDWAFALGTEVADWVAPSERPLITAVLRGDRGKPSDEWLAWFKKLSSELGLSPAVVVQVRRDYVRAQELSSLFAGDYLAWFVDDHAEHEATVREVYRRSSVVVSDRLHALIFGATEGAVPLGWVESSFGKVRRHFDSWQMNWVGVHEGEAGNNLPILDRKLLLDLHGQLGNSVQRLRKQLDLALSDGIR